MKPYQVCQNLRTKKMFVVEEAEELFAKAAEQQGSPHCWCVRTMSEVGPDDKQVGMGICGPGRNCYEE